MIQQKTIFTKEFFLNAFVVFFGLILALINLKVKLYLTPSWFDGTLEQNHKLLLQWKYTNNEQSRLFQFYIPEVICKLFGVSVPISYAIQRLLFTTLTYILFFYYSRKWLSAFWSLAVVLTMAGIMLGTYKNHLQESAALMSLTFLLALWAIREKKDWLYALILIIGSVNNETSLFLPAVYFFANFESFRFSSLSKIVSKTILFALPAFIVVGIIRYITKDQPHLGGALHWEENIDSIHLLFQVFSVIWILAYLPFAGKPVFLKRCLYTIPLFILPHLITGIISETRQMIPLSFILIPSAILCVLHYWNGLVEYIRQRKLTSQSNKN